MGGGSPQSGQGKSQNSDIAPQLHVNQLTLTQIAHAACGRAGLLQALLIIRVANSQIRSAATAAQPIDPAHK